MDSALGLRVLTCVSESPILPGPDELSSLEPSQPQLDFGRALLDLFVRQNFLGPPDETLTGAAVPEERARSVAAALTRDGEAPFHLADALPLLFAARVLLSKAHGEHPSKLSLLWSMKAIDVHQKLLDEKSPTLREEFLSLLETSGDLMTESNATVGVWLDLALRLEALNLAVFYFEHRRAKILMDEALKLATIHAELSGAPGKRTKFQEEHKTQLFLLLKKRDIETEAKETPQCEGLPTDVPLEDDTLLPKIQFADAQATAPAELNATESAFVLALAVYHRHSHPLTTVTEEEVLAYLQALMAQPSDWCVLTEALMLRSRFERRSGRRLQRAIQQMEELSSQFARKAPSFSARRRLFAVSRLPPHWGIQKEYGELLLAEGLLKSALDTFLRWESWDNVINCYVRLGETGSAERVIRSRLESEPESVPLLCALGDVTEAREHYEKAWAVSGERSARAIRSLGFLLCRSGNYAEAVPYMERSLTINPLHHGTAFALGCACLQIEDFERSEHAFRKCTAMEPDDFQAWANLSAVLSRKKEKLKALAVLEEAIRHNYDNWRLWENFLAVGIDTGEFSGVIDALHRLADLRGGRYWDVAVFRVLVRAVNEDIPDRHGRPSAALRQRLSELFGRFTAQGGAEADVWRLYSQLLLGEAASLADLSTESRRKALQFAHKGYATQVGQRDAKGWEVDAVTCATVAQELTEVSRLGLECSSIDEDCRAVLRSSRLAIKSLQSQLRRHHTDLLTGDIVESLRPVSAELDTLYQRMEAELAK